jgi:hypothetical protein
MHLDLRVPIGLMLLVFGLILAGDGLVRGVLVLGVNVNLAWGAFMAACGAATLLFARLRATRSPDRRV